MSRSIFKGLLYLQYQVDKAHPDVLTTLLQLFDEGRLTDGKVFFKLHHMDVFIVTTCG